MTTLTKVGLIGASAVAVGVTVFLVMKARHTETVERPLLTSRATGSNNFLKSTGINGHF